MKNKVILLVDTDADCAGLVLEAAARSGCGVRLSRDSREALDILHREFDRIGSIVLDLDPGTHGLALLETLSALRRRPPVLVLTSLMESYMEPAAARHGVTACLGKPVAIDRLQRAIESVTKEKCRNHESCDPWGHPCGGCEGRACA